MANEVTVLIIDDDELDVEATTRALRKARIGNEIVSAENGEVALELLRGQNGRDRVSRPYIVLLDLNMPRMTGLEFLEELRKDSDLSDSVVFVLTTSDDDRDRWKAYDQNVAGYILKTNVGEGFMNLVNMLDGYWKIVELPLEKGPQ